MRGRLVAVAFILIIFGFGIGAIQQAYFDAGIEGGAANTETETVEVDEGNITTLANSNNNELVYDEEKNVTVEQGSTTFVPQGNWSWNQHNGTIRWVEGSSLTDGNNADVTYTFADPTEEQTIVKDLSVLPLRVLADEWLVMGVVILIFAAAAIVARNA